MPELSRRQDDCHERLAVSLHDLNDALPVLRGRVLALLDVGSAVKVGDGDRSDRALMFRCPLLQAALACDALRDNSVAGGVRVYLRSNGAWKRVPDEARLTLTAPPRLDPTWFPVKIEAEPPRPRKVL